MRVYQQFHVFNVRLFHKSFCAALRIINDEIIATTNYNGTGGMMNKI